MKLHVVTMTPPSFISIQHKVGVEISRWLPSLISEWKHFSKFESPYNALMAATKYRFNSILFVLEEVMFEEFQDGCNVSNLGYQIRLVNCEFPF